MRSLEYNPYFRRANFGPMNRSKPCPKHTRFTSHVSPIPSNQACCQSFWAGPDCNLQLSDPTDHLWAENRFRDRSAIEGSQVLPNLFRLLELPSKTWHCTQHLLPRLRGIEFWLSIRRREGSKVAKLVVWKVTNSNDGSMNSTQGIHEASAPSSEDHQAPIFQRRWIPGPDRERTGHSDIGNRACWQHEPLPLRR